MNNVFDLRKQKGMTQDEFAEFCDVARVSIARYESGGNVNRENAEKIAKACRVSVDWVIGRVSEDEALETEAWAIRERLRRDPSYRMLFSAADSASPEHLRAAAAMLKALEPKKDDTEDAL